MIRTIDAATEKGGVMRHILVLAGLFATASAANAIVVVNNSFELGVTPVKSALLLTDDVTSIVGWKVYIGNVDIVDSATGGWDASDGVKSIDLNGIEAGGVQQTLHLLTPGTAYQLTFDLSGSYTVARTSPNMMAVSASGNAEQSFSYDKVNFVNDMMYESLTYTFTATASDTVIKFRGLDQGDYGAVLDNVGIQLAPVLGPPTSVGGVPEPAAWALMVAGFGLVGVSARRRAATRSVAA